MKFEILALPLPGNRQMNLYRFLVDGVEYIRQISAIGAYDVTKRLEDAGKQHLVTEALRQLGMKPWRGDSAPAAVETPAAAESPPRGPGRVTTDAYAHYRDEPPDRIPEEAVPGVAT